MPIKLDNQICFTLYTTTMAITRAYKAMLDDMGLTYPQYLVLNVLGEQDGQMIGAIATRLTLESSTVTPLVKRLELAGLVTRRRSLEDERQVQVYLTESGRALVVRSGCLAELMLERSGMTVEQLGALNLKIQGLRSAMYQES